MIEIVTAVSAASGAFNTIKKGFAAGREIESMAGDLSDGWVQFQILKKQKSIIKNRLCLRSYLTLVLLKKRHGNLHGPKKKAEDMRNELKQIISFTRDFICLGRTSCVQKQIFVKKTTGNLRPERKTKKKY